MKVFTFHDACPISWNGLINPLATDFCNESTCWTGSEKQINKGDDPDLDDWMEQAKIGDKFLTGDPSGPLVERVSDEKEVNDD